MDDKYYTAGEIARIAGVSLRTIRYYDAKGCCPRYPIRIRVTASMTRDPFPCFSGF